MVVPALGGGVSLVVRDLQGSDQQQYTCRAVNSVAAATLIVPLLVTVPPTVNITVETVATQGSPLVLDCQVMGQPFPTVTWSRNSFQILEDARLSVDGAGRLTFSTVFSTDAGTYRCTAANELASVAAETVVQVQVIPVIQVSMPMVTASDGATAVLDCLATGNPAPVITWFFNSAQLPSPLNPRIQQAPNNSLLFSPVRSSDEGTYICQATNRAGTESATLQLTVHVGPVVVAVDAMVTAIVSMETTLRCTASGDPTPVQSWTRNGMAITDSRFQVLVGGSALRITNVREGDEGAYQCHASNVAGTNSATVNLNVISIPVVQIPSRTPTSVQGGPAVLDCVASGDPSPVVTWFFGSVPLPGLDGSRIQQAPNSSLIISPVQTRDRGEYRCMATNAAGNDSATLSLTVYVAPAITAVVRAVTVVVGNSVTMSCVATGDPAPTQTWTRGGVGVTGPRVSTNGSSLTLRDTTVQDEGTYTCHASNPAGTQTDTVMLNIIVPPTITAVRNSTVQENTLHSMTCSATGDPAPSITWMFEGRVLSSFQGTLTFAPVVRTQTGAYTCTATNAAGTASQQVHLDVQYLPEIVEAPANVSVPIGSSASFSCVANANPPATITWLFNSVLIPGAQQSTYTVATVTGTSGGTYTCVASNAIGITHGNAILTPIFPPSAPILFSGTAISPNVISLRWAASADDGGSQITGYSVEYRDTGAGSSATFTSRSFPGETLNTNLDGLTPFVNYEVRVRAENVAGLSDASNSLQAQTHPDAPSSPTNFRVVSSTPTSLSLSWGRPEQLNGQFAVYEIRYSEEATFATSLTETLLFAPQFTLLGVAVGVVYRLEVRASTIGLSSETLWGPYAVLRVRDGMELEIPTTPPTTPPPPTTPMSTLPPSTEPPSTEPPTTEEPSTLPPSTPSTLPANTEPPTTEPPTTEAPNTEPPSMAPQTTEETEPPTMPLNPPTSVPLGLMVLNVPGAFGEVLIYWRQPPPEADDFIGYSVDIAPAPPPAVTTPILVPRRSGNSITHVLMGLANFTRYTFTVATYNNDGLGPQTQTTSIRTTEAPPSAPRAVDASVFGANLVLVSWLPPDPLNGVLTSYLLRVLREPTGEEVNSTIIPVSLGQQQDAQSVTLLGLELESSRYRVLVSASTRAGRGQSSEPIIIGAEVATTPPPETTPTPPDATTETSNTTDEDTTMTQQPTTETTMQPVTTDTITTMTDTNGTDITPALRDDVYYVIRIVPPIAGGFLLLAVVLIILFCCVHRYTVHKKKKGLYRIQEKKKNEYSLRDMPDMGESLVLEDSETDGSEFIKDQFDSNFTAMAPEGATPRATPGTATPVSYNSATPGALNPATSVAYNTATPGAYNPAELDSFGADFGTLDNNDDKAPAAMPLATPASAMGRDAVQETEEQPDEFILSPPPPLPLNSMQQPPQAYRQGDMSQHAQFQAPQRAKSREPAYQQGWVQHTSAMPSHHQPPQGSMMSSGGLMETRIGSVGPQASDYMY